MAKMHFKYASMNSGKSTDLIRTAYNYEENGYKVLVVKDHRRIDYIRIDDLVTILMEYQHNNN